MSFQERSLSISLWHETKSPAFLLVKIPSYLLESELWARRGLAAAIFCFQKSGQKVAKKHTQPYNKVTEDLSVKSGGILLRLI